MGADRLLTSPSDGVSVLMRVANAGFLSGTRHCPMVASDSVCRTTVPNSVLGSSVNERKAFGGGGVIVTCAVSETYSCNFRPSVIL